MRPINFKYAMRLFRRREPEYDWVIELPDGAGATGKVSYKGKRLPVMRAVLDIYGNDVATLTLVVHARKLGVVMNILDPEVKVVGEAGECQA